ncbi:hypothetical protein J6590_062329 [Homalodisca vitripennis]|nr:hypothetical protein J6590_062329 [Homalodisca vitripennis]
MAKGNARELPFCVSQFGFQPLKCDHVADLPPEMWSPRRRRDPNRVDETFKTNYLDHFHIRDNLTTKQLWKITQLLRRALGSCLNIVVHDPTLIVH